MPQASMTVGRRPRFRYRVFPTPPIAPSELRKLPSRPSAKDMTSKVSSRRSLVR